MLFQHSCRLGMGSPNHCLYLLLLWKVKSEGQVFQGSSLTAAIAFNTVHTQRQVSEHDLHFHWKCTANDGDEILCNAETWCSTQQAIYRTLWFHLARRSKVTSLKAHSRLYSIIETESFTWCLHQTYWLSMALQCTDAHGNASFTANACIINSHKNMLSLYLWLLSRTRPYSWIL